MLNIGPQELLLILVVALLVVGPRRLPELGRSLGKGLRELRKAQNEVRKTIQVELDDEPRPASPKPPAAARPPDGDGADGASTDGVASAGAASAVGEVSKTLGRSLAELRKARQEIQRSFRVDLEEPAGPRRSTAPGASAASEGASPQPDRAVGPDAGVRPE
jgi:TatA/E family protein of Tat protein translocase